MDITVLNTNLDAISIVDVYESFIWTDRYYEYGDFELFTSMTDTILSYIKQDYYLQNRESEHVMIIEMIRIGSDSENGNHITVTGRSLESILDRRIVWGQKTITGNLQNGIHTLLNENVISPADSSRKIANFIFEASTDPAITSLKIDAQYTGDNLYDVINKICSERSIGFKVTLNDNKQFVFKLYAGIDRSYDQSVNPYVIFSPKFENIINSNYVESKSALKTVTLVGGEGENGLQNVELLLLAEAGGEGVAVPGLALSGKGPHQVFQGLALFEVFGHENTASLLLKYGGSISCIWESIRLFDQIPGFAAVASAWVSAGVSERAKVLLVTFLSLNRASLRRGWRRLP